MRLYIFMTNWGIFMLTFLIEVSIRSMRFDSKLGDLCSRKSLEIYARGKPPPSFIVEDVTTQPSVELSGRHFRACISSFPKRSSSSEAFCLTLIN